MEPERWHRVEQLYHSALRVPSEQRTVFLKDECKDDEEVRKEVESLLSYEASAQAFIESPAFDVAAKLMAADKSNEDVADLAAIAVASPRFHLLEKLGAGGMGVVYKAEDTKLGRRTALKFLPDELSADPGAMQRLEREARAASTLNHPNICTIYDVEEHNGQPFIVMEFVEGRTLRDVIAAGKTRRSEDKGASSPFLLQTFLDVAIQIAKGLEAAHQKGIIHRDIKPANILISHDGQAKILDFGLARIEEAKSARAGPGAPLESSASDCTLTGIGMAIGTAGYMSPEQVRGEILDARTDLFSFGLVLYEMAVGERAFTGETAEILQDAILHSSPRSVRELNSKFLYPLELLIAKALEKDRNLRYQSATDMRTDLQRLKRDLDADSRNSQDVRMGNVTRITKAKRWKILASATGVLAVAAGIWWWPSQSSVSAARLTEKDTILIADFTNSTGEPIFDETLRPALRSSLEQSPFLNIVSDGRARSSLTKMEKPADTRLTPDIARDVCRRVQSKAYISGAVASLGNEYVIGLKAVNCLTAATLGEQQATADNKENVLKALGSAVSKLREQLGESLPSIAKFDIPFEQTTTSLEALREYEVGMKTVDQDVAGSLPHLLRAIQIDPDFAMAYLSTAETYSNMNQSARATEYYSKAFELRDHADGRERLEIESVYYGLVTGDLDKAAQSYRKTIESYPKSSPSPWGNLSYVYSQKGDYEKGLQLAQEVLKRAAFGGEAYEGIAENLLPLHRLDEARQILQAAVDRKLDIDGVHKDLYALAFVSGDPQGMSAQLTWLENKPEYANLGLSLESDTAAYAGQLRRARTLTDQAVEDAMRSDNKEAAAIWRTNGALREAMFGNPSLARQYAEAALKLARDSQHVRIQAALALATTHQSTRARALIQELAKEFPQDTQVQSMWLPTINAQMAITENKPEVALNQLNRTASTELGAVPFSTAISCLYPVYIRGQAYLQGGKGNAAANEFQKMLDHKGIVWNCPTGALAYLGIGRANALEAQGSQGVSAEAARTRARNGYRDFFNLWHSADSDIPVLRQARAEYAELQ